MPVLQRSVGGGDVGKYLEAIVPLRMEMASALQQNCTDAALRRQAKMQVKS